MVWSASSFSSASTLPRRRRKFDNDDPLHFVCPPDEFDATPRFSADGVWVAYPKQQQASPPAPLPLFRASSSVYAASSLHNHDTKEAATAVPRLKKQKRAERVGVVQYVAFFYYYCCCCCCCCCFCFCCFLAVLLSEKMTCHCI